jgi:hypothetical protein
MTGSRTSSGSRALPFVKDPDTAPAGWGGVRVHRVTGSVTLQPADRLAERAAFGGPPRRPSRQDQP